MMALRNTLIAVTLLVAAACHAGQDPMEKDRKAIVATLSNMKTSTPGATP